MKIIGSQVRAPADDIHHLKHQLFGGDHGRFRENSITFEENNIPRAEGNLHTPLNSATVYSSILSQICDPRANMRNGVLLHNTMASPKHVVAEGCVLSICFQTLCIHSSRLHLAPDIMVSCINLARMHRPKGLAGRMHLTLIILENYLTPLAMRIFNIPERTRIPSRHR